MQENNRGQWSSSFGFLMASIGSAIGLGNLWGFPYKMGSSGGFAFLVIYLVLVLLVGIPLMTAEFALGRKTGTGAGAYAKLSKKYRPIGWMANFVPFVILSFYAVLAGMTLRYCLGFLVQIVGIDGFSGQGSGFFGYLLYDSSSMVIFLALALIITMVIVMGGVQGGIEKFSKTVMPALGVILIVIIIFVATQDGAVEGYKFMFKPDLSLFSDPESFFGVLKVAAGQMFFSLSLAMGINITFGSYLTKDRDIQKNALIVPFSDTLFAVLAGMMIMPACAAFGVDFGAGPGLLFASMQNVFLDGMGGLIGNVMGFLFYFLVFIAAITSAIALLEVCASSIVDRQIEKGKNPNRKKISLILAVCLFVVGLPAALDALGSGGALLKAPFELLGLEIGGPGYAMWNDCWLDFYDMLTEGVLMPLGALLMSLLLGWKLPNLVKEECEEGGRPFKFAGYFKIAFRIVIPVIMLIVLYTQIQAFFNI
ncbi:MAG: sodium-dependent transporter [Ruminiclostridium sp.]|nr:sodium-dependent transporter [Ruminiclostridium sp.]